MYENVLKFQTKVKSLCYKYSLLPKMKREDLLSTLASEYAVDHTVICKMSQKLACTEVYIVFNNL